MLESIAHCNQKLSIPLFLNHWKMLSFGYYYNHVYEPKLIILSRSHKIWKLMFLCLEPLFYDTNVKSVTL